MRQAAIRAATLSAAAIASAGFAPAASAADLPLRRGPAVYAPPVAPPPFSWSGFYAGGNVGGGFDDDTSYGLAGITPGGQAFLATGARPGYLLTNASGIAAGGQVGYNFQLGQGLIGSALDGFGATLSPVTGLFGLGASSGPVAGIEADADYTDFRRSVGFVGTTGLATIANSHQHFLGTVRGRLGYGFGNLLAYGTGGFAYGGVGDNVTTFNRFAGFGGVNRIETGYAFGGGVEYAIPTSSFLNVLGSSAVTLKAEYLHYVLGDDAGIVTSNAANYTVRVLNYGNVARAGINYKFDFGRAQAPVVAPY